MAVIKMEISDIQDTADWMGGPVDLPGKEIECPDCNKYYPADQ